MKSIVVIGDGWSALTTVGFYSTQNDVQLTWIVGTGARILSPLPSLQAGFPTYVIQTLLNRLGMGSESSQNGHYLREFRNKAFREPLWTQAPTSEARIEVINETLWAPERAMIPVFESRFAVTLAEVEEKIRERILQNPAIRRVEGVPVSEIKFKNDKIHSVFLSNGEEVLADQLIYADRWNVMSKISGLPKLLSFTKKRNPMGALQAVFTHSVPMGMGLKEGFFCPMHKEAGEEIERNSWGYFSADGSRSFWTVYLTSEEVEDNHEITKKFRRLKNSLNKMFESSSWLPAGKTDFTSNIADEHVRLEEALIFSSGEIVLDPISVFQEGGVFALTDGYGFSNAVHQVGSLFGLKMEMGRTDSQAEHMDFSYT